MTLQLSDEEIAWLAGIMCVQGTFARTGGAARRIGWIVGSKNSPQTVTKIAELVQQRVRNTKRGDYVIVAGQDLDELMEIVSEWLDSDRYDEYLRALELAANIVAEKKQAHAEEIAKREARVREDRLMTREHRRQLAEAAYRNQDPAIQVIDDVDVNENEVNRAIARRQIEERNQR
ncbi:hypothetical protein PBI_TRISCUIT_101 [Microbacterium phage Triscuit]|nr:hypothetical protein PBI_TRISCUIT_101 [Microbacterium phage Triscuit]